MNTIVRSPETSDEWDQYFNLRWEILRQPWQQDRGSEKDELEGSSTHRLAITNNQITAVGRIHFIAPDEAQIRYMAVAAEFQHQGLGKGILLSLETAALTKNIRAIHLNARESAIAFYKKHDYKIVKESHTLYEEIRHFKMLKTL